MRTQSEIVLLRKKTMRKYIILNLNKIKAPISCDNTMRTFHFIYTVRVKNLPNKSIAVITACFAVGF